MHIEQIGKRAIVFVEKVFVKHGSRHHFVAMQREKLQETVFARGQCHRRPSTTNRPTSSVNAHFADFD